MRRQPYFLCGGLVLSVGLCLLTHRGDAGGEKEPWQAMLPKEVYQELARREMDIIRERLNGKADEAAIMRARVGATFLAALTMSAKDLPAEEARGTRAAALRLVKTLEQKGQLAAAKKLAAKLPNAKLEPNAKSEIGNWAELITMAEFMDHLRPKDKGGDGMHPDLQSNIRLKGALNGIEEKVMALAMKELAPTAIKKEAKELELLGYRTAVIGALSYYYGPAAKSGKKDPAEWRKLSLQTRDHSAKLAVAASKGDAPTLYKAGSDLNSSCAQCHAIFR